jgi:hypothetical protein
MITAAEDDRFLGDATADVDPDAPGARDGPGAFTAASASHETVGQQIDRYKLLEQIGEGGFGSVWAAEQKRPVKRRVALKIIKLGMDTKQVIARFEAERQALAMMDHPNIAKVLDAGTTETGRPFFVMELVRASRSSSTATRRSWTPRPGSICSPGSATRSSTRTRRASSTATSSPATCWSPCTTACLSPRSSTSESRRRPTRS